VRIAALAADYDGTLADRGQVTRETIRALERFRESGRKLILVTGRELDDLASVFPRFDLFDLMVLENGAVLYEPAARRKQILAHAPDASFLAALKERGVPFGSGDVIVGTPASHAAAALETIRDLGLDLRVIMNKDSAMILPSGVDKVSGFGAAIRELGLDAQETAGIGDAENDIGFLQACGYSAAVANALPSVKKIATVTLRGGHGDGVIECIDMILRNVIHL
jgi:hydroxymethylpyrimidine pyrophosphatase-like HAD family hydrolase